jgi:hypothetical protein
MPTSPINNQIADLENHEQAISAPFRQFITYKSEQPFSNKAADRQHGTSCPKIRHETSNSIEIREIVSFTNQAT